MHKAPKNIFLIGPMGVGKTTIGRHLARLLRMDFLDSDQEIEKRTGAAIPLIFEIEGEEGFRKRESAMLDELTQGDNRVLATGGGAILSDENRRMLRTRGLVVYLRASLETQLERTSRKRNRPLLNTGDPRRRLTELMAQREPFYQQEADITVDTDDCSPAAVARQIVSELEAT
jgi:shikimate kinase